MLGVVVLDVLDETVVDRLDALDQFLPDNLDRVVRIRECEVQLGRGAHIK